MHWWSCDAMMGCDVLRFWDASIMLWSFVTSLQTWLQKIVACAMMRCDVLLFWDAMIFCNNFANMITNDSRMRCASDQSDACFVTTLQGWVYKTQKKCKMHGWSSDGFFVTRLQGWAYKTQQTSAYAPQTKILDVRTNRLESSSPNRVLTSLKSDSRKRRHDRSFVPSYEIFVRGHRVLFVKTLQGWAYKTQTKCKMHHSL